MHRRACELLVALLALLALSCGALEGIGSSRAAGAGAADPANPYLSVTSSDDQPQTGGRLHYGLPSETNSWNPGIAQWGAYSMQVARALFDPAYTFDAEGNVQSNLYERVEHNADFTEWTSTLRPGIKFHNGRPLTARDIARAQNIYLTSPVVGKTYQRSSIESYRALDDRTVQVRTRKPWPMMRQQSTSQLSFVVDPDWLESGDHLNPVGTGPFKMDRWVPDQRLSVVRNPYYWRTDKWGNRLPYLERIDFEIVTDDQERANRVQDGRLDVMIQTVPAPNVVTARELCRQGRLQCLSDEKLSTPENIILLNTTKPPFNDVDARRALALAVDRNEVARRVAGGLNEPADGPFLPKSRWYTPSTYPGYDPKGAAKLVERVKARSRSQFRVELLTSPSNEGVLLGRYLEEAWEKVGVDVEVVVVETRKRIIRHVSGEYQASFAQLFDGESPTAVTAYVDTPPLPDNEPTIAFPRLSDPGVSRLVDELLANDPDQVAAVRAASARLLDRVNELVPFLWLDHAPRTVIARPNVVNLTRDTLPDGRTAADFHLGSHGLAQVWTRR